MKLTKRVRVVVCGGGAGGLELVTRLARRRELDVALIEREDAHLWKPLLHELASGSLDPAAHEVAYLALARWHGFTFHHGALAGLDRAQRLALVDAVVDQSGATIIPQRRIVYDILVIAVGGVTNDFGVPGVGEHAVALDTPQHAEQIRRLVLRACMSANYAEPGPAKHRYHIAIVGGGATGVELAAELRAATQSLIAYGLDRLDASSFVAITLVNADPRLLMQLPEPLAQAVAASLRDLGIAVVNGEAVVKVDNEGLLTKAGRVVAADLVVWAAGVRAAELLTCLDGLETNRARQLVVTPELRTTCDNSIYAIGDCAACPWLGRSALVPARAQASHQQAVHLASQLPLVIAGARAAPFRYRDLGSLVSLGPEGSAIGTLMSLLTGRNYRVEGLLARLFYKWLYKRHRATLFGWWAVTLETVSSWMGGLTRPHIKLH